jgi:hypothetical protein
MLINHVSANAIGYDIYRFGKTWMCGVRGSSGGHDWVQMVTAHHKLIPNPTDDTYLIAQTRYTTYSIFLVNNISLLPSLTVWFPKVFFK